MIKKIKWKNHNSLGNLLLDLTKPDGTAYNTIILAGENGSGKTTVLDTLSDFLNGMSFEPFDYIDYEVLESDYHIVPDQVNSSVGFHKRAIIGTEEYEQVNSGRRNNEDALRNDRKDIRSYGFAYSKARSGFNTNQVKFVTTQQVDIEKFEPDSSDDYTHIKQLIIDIEQQDDAAWRTETEQRNVSDKKYDEFVIHRSKGYRFQKAFNTFFDLIKYAGVNNDNPQEKQVIFEKHGSKIPVDNLSTGEKQIVFRGAHLLRNLNSISGGIVLIDEPELSMHPMWQRRILQYYRGLFTDNNGIQKVQLIIATHSEYVLRAALVDRDNVLVIALKDNNGVIESNRITAPSVLPTITAAEINYLVFNVLTVDYHIALYGYLQSKEELQSVKVCDNYIRQSSCYDESIHNKQDTYRGVTYQTLPTYIRNAIDHPDSGRTYTEEEFRTSTKLLIELCTEKVSGSACSETL